MTRPARCLLALILVASGAAAREIWEIQGAGAVSPYEGQTVTVPDNTVTAVGDGFFFVQTPDHRADGDPWTSDGILVRHSGAPTVAEGDRVTVTGSVEESYGQTEIRRNVEVTRTSSGHPLPRPVTLDELTPTPNQPWPETELERFEGMLVNVADGVVSGPTDRYGDACVAAALGRRFREPGIASPGLPGLPVWDGNPEIFEIDPDALGGAAVDLTAGSRFSAGGVLAFAYGSYQLWPTRFELTGLAPLPRPVATSSSRRLTVASQNCRRLDNASGDDVYQLRLAKLSRQVRVNLGAPSVVALQEVESLAVLEDLAARISADDPALVYSAHLVEGNDSSGIDVGFLVLGGVVVDSVRQIGDRARFSWDQSLLFDRPPLVLETRFGELVLSVVVVHLRSLNGVDDPGSSGERVRRKRFEQSEWIAGWVQDHQLQRADDGLLLVGDFNAFEFSDGYVDVLGQVTGRPDPAGALIPAEQVVVPPLTNAALSLPAGERYSYVYRGSAELLDHALVDVTLQPLLLGMSFARGNADAPESAAEGPDTALRSSDHDGFVVAIGAPVRRSGGRRVP
ncbi:MAG: hypothetical protein V2I67_18125 [Thermoanaerobaculales bacterium]|nr:hypothetical protein [Thermoanaerobaculales bacterium]